MGRSAEVQLVHNAALTIVGSIQKGVRVWQVQSVDDRFCYYTNERGKCCTAGV